MRTQLEALHGQIRDNNMNAEEELRNLRESLGEECRGALEPLLRQAVEALEAFDFDRALPPVEQCIEKLEE